MAYGRIPEAFIDDVLLRADIVDLGAALLRGRAS